MSKIFIQLYNISSCELNYGLCKNATTIQTYVTERDLETYKDLATWLWHVYNIKLLRPRQANHTAQGGPKGVATAFDSTQL